MNLQIYTMFRLDGCGGATGHPPGPAGQGMVWQWAGSRLAPNAWNLPYKDPTGPKELRES